jgi:hypothetical protein
MGAGQDSKRLRLCPFIQSPFNQYFCAFRDHPYEHSARIASYS